MHDEFVRGTNNIRIFLHISCICLYMRGELGGLVAMDYNEVTELGYGMDPGPFPVMVSWPFFSAPPYHHQEN
jgi:hypothetical protein